VKSFLVGEVREGRCPKHGRRVERVPWACPAARHTREFDRQVAGLARISDKSATSRMFNVSWVTVGRIVERVVREILPKDRLAGLRAISIDETSHKRGHRYLTVVSCLRSRRVVWLGRGKSGDTLRQFFDELGTERAKKLEVVAMDMGEAYRGVVEDCAPQADIVFDRFHVVKLLLEAIDEVLREECRKLEGEARKDLKNTRFALLRNPRYLKPRDRKAIARIKATNRRLFRAYELREDFEELWQLKSEDEARSFLEEWTRAALLSTIEPLKRFARTMQKHMHHILGFFRQNGVSSSLSEGLNNKIKLVIHRAFGFADLGALMSMIYLCCGPIDPTLLP
jgi:transposase